MSNDAPTAGGLTHEHEPLPEGEEEAPPGVRVMAIVRWVLVIAMALAATASVLHYFGAFSRSGVSATGKQYYCPMHPSVVQDHPGECPICSMTLVEKTGGTSKPPATSTPMKGTANPADPYYCPMHPNETSQDPNAKCPECGMKMVPRPANEKPMSMGAAMAAMPMSAEMNKLAPIDLTPERIQLLGMRTARVRRETLSPELRTVGFVTANEEGLARVNTRFSGWIERLFVNKTGERVAHGQPLANIYSPDVLAAEQEFLNARKWKGGADNGSAASQVTSGLYDDARRRLELLGISAREIDELDKSGQPVRALTIRSPVDGYVTTKNALQGLFVQPGTALFEIADLSTIWVLADIYESEVGRVRVGEKTRLTLTAYPGERFTGRVQFIYPTVDSDTRTVKVRLEFKNAKLRLLPGMYGDVVIELGRAEGVVVPAEAIVDTGEVQYVFLAEAGGHFTPREVELGMRSGTNVQILGGVREGETVVTTANFLIDSESRLRATIEGATGGESTEAVPIDKDKFPDKYQQWKQCEIQHRGMGTMEEDCKNAIPKPWR